MNVQRFIASLLALCLLLVFALGLYLRRSGEPSSPPASSSPTAAPKPTETATPDAAAHVEHRLAGTVVGDEQYVVVEHPDGRNELYRPGQTVPGLGKVGQIGPDNATFEADGRRITLRLLPAPTPTLGTPASAPQEVEATPDPKRVEPPPPGRSGSGSSPSDDSDRSAS
jgi:hypothetical protein